MTNKNIVKLICGLILAAYTLAGALCSQGVGKIVAGWQETSQGH